MNNREKFLSVLNFAPDAQIPIIHFGYWDETIEKWVQEGHIRAEDDVDTISQKLGFDFGYAATYTNHTVYPGYSELFPEFEREVVKELADGSFHVRNNEGVIELQKPGAGSIPMEIEHTLVDRESWEKEYKWRLQFDEKRYNFDQLVEYSKRDAPLGIFAGSLYGRIRNWFGLVELSYISSDDEELYDEVIETVGQLAYDVVKFILEKGAELGVKFDYIHFWEDICFNHGPLVSPLVFEEKVGHTYKKIVALGKEHDVTVFSVDCDGQIDKLMSTWIENGVNTMFPIEVGTWHASIAPWREQYGRKVVGIGGVDKKVFARDFQAVDQEIERLKPLIELGGYIPCPDHLIPPDAKFENVQYYCEQLRKAVKK